MKNTKLNFAIFGLLLLATIAPSSNAALSIGVVANGSTGYFLSSAGGQLTTGGISAGYFSTDGTAAAIYQPTLTHWGSLLSGGASNAWSSLISLGWRDVRSVAGTLPTDWSFASGGTPTGVIGGTASNISATTLPTGTRLYVIAFDSGSWGGSMATSTFGGTEWGVVSAWGHANTAENYSSPADLGSKSLQLKSANLTASDVLVGSLNPSYATNFSVNLVPEPSTGALMMIGAVGLVALRRLRKV